MITVIEKMEMKVVMAMEDESNSVSSPIFSAWISGRLPAGPAPIRQRARVDTVSKPASFMTRTIATGTMIIRRTI